MPNAATINDALQFSRAGNHAAAERACHELLRASPTDAAVWCHLGTTCLLLQRLNDAIKAYEQAVKYKPDFPEAQNNLGVALSRVKRYDEAISIFRRAAEQRPGWAEPWISLGNLYTNTDRTDEAVEAFAMAVRAEPEKAETHNMLGSMVAKQGARTLAIVHFQEALRLNPRYDVAHSNLLLAMNYDPDIEPEIMLNEHRWWDRLHGLGLTAIKPHTNDRIPERPLRIGYVSPDFRKHVVTSFLMPIFAAHDRKQFQVYAYAEVPQADATTEKYRSLAAAYRVTVNATHAQVAEAIRSDKIDILIDLAGHTGGNRLGTFAFRPAPVQITYLGYPATTGLSSIQYRFSDAIADPIDEVSDCTEAIVRLPGCFCCWQPPENAQDVSPAPCASGGGVTFGSMHKLPKLNKYMLDLWAELLCNVPDSQLVIFRNTLDESVRKRLIAEFGARGIDEHRLQISSGNAREGAHLPVFSRIDILLDTLPWSGHATTCEATWMGVPVVTLLGDRHAGRMSASILSTIGLKELIATTKQEYLDIATNLASDRERLIRMRGELREQMRSSPLCDAAGFTRRLEEAYRVMWRRWCTQPRP